MDSSGNLNFRDPSIEEFDTTIHLAHAAKQAAERNYDDFLRRLQIHAKRLDELGVNYRRSAAEVK